MSVDPYDASYPPWLWERLTEKEPSASDPPPVIDAEGTSVPPKRKPGRPRVQRQ